MGRVDVSDIFDLQTKKIGNNVDPLVYCVNYIYSVSVFGNPLGDHTVKDLFFGLGELLFRGTGTREGEKEEPVPSLRTSPSSVTSWYLTDCTYTFSNVISISSSFSLSRTRKLS